MRRKLWPFVVVSLAAFALLFRLGVWQVERLAEKNALISKIDARIAADPIELEPVLAEQEKGSDVEYTKISAHGHYLAATDLHKITTYDGGAAYELIAPFLTSNNTAILVDRGAAPVDAKPIPPGSADVTITGILRAHAKGQGLFDGDNDPAANQWIWWDIPAMLGSAAIPADSRISRMILQLVPEDGTSDMFPKPAVPKAELRNNHLGYAITWFGLAAVWAAMTAVLVLRQRKGNA